MNGVLFAIYVVAAWNPHNDPNMIHWHEFIIPHHRIDCIGPSYCDEDPLQFFHTRNVCERYRERLVANWIAKPDIPLNQKNIVSTRCGVWPDTDEGQKL